MSRTPQARINPQLLVWARTSLGLSAGDAARRIGVSADRLASWESGDVAPSVAQLRKAANVFKRPLAVFFLPEPPTEFDAMRDFRRLPESESAHWSPQLHAVFRRARRQSETALELLETLDERVEPARLAVYPDDPEEFAAHVRELLGVTLAEQFSWREPYAALSRWIDAVEYAGVLVLQTGEVELEEMRGFSIADGVLSVVVVNAKDAPRGRIFSVLHELAHVLLRNGGLCDFSDHGGSSEETRVEVFCNRVAAAILMPRDSFLAESVVRTHEPAAEWSDDELAALGDRYGASREAVLRRLVSLGRSTMAFYLRKREEYLRAYAERRAEESGFAPYHRVKIRDLGRSYVRLVLDAYHRDELTASDLADSLGMKLKHLPKVEAEVLGIRA